MALPPLSLPPKALRRVKAISRVNGWGVAVVAGVGTLLSLLFSDFSGAAVGAVVTCAGVMEIRGNRQLEAGNADGMRGLVNAQMLALSVILIYCTWQLQFFDPAPMVAKITPEMATLLEERGLMKADFPIYLRLLATLVFSVFGVVSIIYQGGLMFYYRSRRRLVAEALPKPPVM